MDLERIKQNFRIRSGRARKPKKHHKPNAAQVGSKDSSHPSPQTPEKEKEPSTATASPISARKTSTIGGSQGEDRPETDQATETSPSSVNEQPDGASSKNQEELTQNIDGNPNSSLHRSRSGSLESEASTLEPQPPGPSDTMADTQLDNNASSSEADDFDLPPPKPRSKPPSTETMCELLFSSGHLDALLGHTPQLTRFSAFLQRYSPENYPLLAQYLETRKAVKAVEYANAVAEGFKPKETGGDHSTDTRSMAAKLDPEFEAICSSSFQALMNDALPSYISYSLVKFASEIMTNEITGRSTPIMRDLVDGLSEVFCLTDPNQEDNPIIYASEEFYRFTRYGPDDVLNHNCRFLQGRKTNPLSPKRLKNAITNGDEISETLLNYKRDGRPFINLLMIAPLHDRNGKLKYHIGAQIDVTGLVEGGRALESFQRYLARRGDDKRREEIEKADANLDDEQRRKRRALARLRDLSETFDLEEAAVVQAGSRSSSLTRDEDDTGSLASVERQKGQRRVYMDSDASEDEGADGDDGKTNGADWKLGDSGDGKLSGKLPGVYDSFILFRPAPSFRIVFISPKLRRLGNVVQSPFLSHIAAPSGTLNGLAESLKTGVPVSAKVHFKPERGERRDGTRLRGGSKHEDGKNGRAIWVSCTPLLGDDEAIGVWMCVVVEKSKVGSISKRRDLQPDGLAEEADAIADAKTNEKAENSVPLKDIKAAIASENNTSKREDIPIKPVRIDSQTVIKAQVEKSPESAEDGQNQTSKTVRPQQSIYFDAEQDNNIDTQETSDRREMDQAVANEDTTLSNDQNLTPSQERDPRAVVTPVPEYADEGEESKSYEFETRGSSPSSEYHQEADDEYVATRSPTTPPHQSSSRVVIEEDSDVLQDSDLDHHHENVRVGRSRTRSSSSRSLNSPASDIPPSVPSSAMVADEGEDEGEHEADASSKVDSHGADETEESDDLEEKTEDTPEAEDKTEDEPKEPTENAADENNITPTATRHHRSPTPPENDAGGEDEHLEESQTTIKPAEDQSPTRNSDHDSAISLDSPAQPREKSTSKSRSRSHSQSPRPETSSQEADDDEEQESSTPKNLEFADNVPMQEKERERDVENWLTEGRPSSNQNNVGSKASGPGHDHKHSHVHTHGNTHKHTQSNTTTRAVASGLRLDFLGTGENRWAARQPRRRLNDDSEDYGDDGGSDEDEDALTRSDHCATSPYSVD